MTISKTNIRFTIVSVLLFSLVGILYALDDKINAYLAMIVLTGFLFMPSFIYFAYFLRILKKDTCHYSLLDIHFTSVNPVLYILTVYAFVKLTNFFFWNFYDGFITAFEMSYHVMILTAFMMSCQSLKRKLFVKAI